MSQADAEFLTQETLRDRGQLTRAEYETFFAMCRFELVTSLHENLEDAFADDVYRKSKLIYDESGFDFEGHTAIGFGWKTFWFAIRSTDLIGLINLLSPSFGVEQHRLRKEYAHHALPSDDFRQRVDNQYFTLTQVCNGTIFVRVSGKKADDLWDVCEGPLGHYHEVINQNPIPCAAISKELGDTYFFWTQRVIGNNGFILWRDGQVKRAASTVQLEAFKSKGKELDGEETWRASDGSGNDMHIITEWELFQMAHKWHVNPNRMPLMRPNEKVYCWFVDARQW